MAREPNKSQDLQLASWRPRRADSAVPIWDWSSNLKAEDLRPKKDWVFSSIMNPRKERMSQFTDSQAGNVPSYSGKGQPFHSIQAFSWLDEAHPHCGRQPTLFIVHWFKCWSRPKPPFLTYKINHLSWHLTDSQCLDLVIHVGIQQEWIALSFPEMSFRADSSSLARPDTIHLLLVPGLHGQAQHFLRWTWGLEDPGFQSSLTLSQTINLGVFTAYALILKEKETLLFLRID